MIEKLLILFCLLLSINLSFAQEECFPKKVDGKFIYDIGNVLSQSEEARLQSELSSFTKRTSNVIVIVTTNDLCGTDKAQFAIELGDQLGVGREDKDNGLVFLVKPKVGNSRGEIFIAVGTGLQGAITDAGTRRIIDYEVIPYFKQGSYFGGINAGTQTLMRLAEGEISESDYLIRQENNGTNGIGVTIVIVLIFLILIIIIGRNSDGDDWENYDRHGKHRGRRGGSPWIIIGGGGGSSGGGGFGGGSFGGFGGGGFSGGGAGGSW